MPAENEYLSPKEAAAIYRISTRTILRLIHEGVLPAVKITARTWRIRCSDLEAAFPSTGTKPATGEHAAGPRPSEPPRVRTRPRRPPRSK